MDRLIYGVFVVLYLFFSSALLVCCLGSAALGCFSEGSLTHLCASGWFSRWRGLTGLDLGDSNPESGSGGCGRRQTNIAKMCACILDKQMVALHV